MISIGAGTGKTETAFDRAVKNYERLGKYVEIREAAQKHEAGEITAERLAEIVCALTNEEAIK